MFFSALSSLLQAGKLCFLLHGFVCLKNNKANGRKLAEQRNSAVFLSAQGIWTSLAFWFLSQQYLNLLVSYFFPCWWDILSCFIPWVPLNIGSLHCLAVTNTQMRGSSARRLLEAFCMDLCSPYINCHLDCGGKKKVGKFYLGLFFFLGYVNTASQQLTESGWNFWLN